ncbi:hypothetical protein [Terrisporobacter glycolicus]|uniref:DUF4830 domain-containing protein n=1 Tax=Terrisporobacter glycolicus ATCC 14880 = DSM 1288 TaxID=1121315 RepID=A0ABZ2EPT0_9FIRM|nr:hypothetical protein [Terrisporobacter glycolicus]
MKAVKYIINCTIILIVLFIAGCNHINNNNIDQIALEEAKRIVANEGYSLESQTLSESDILVGDAGVFKLIKEASIEGGYSKDDFNSMTEDRRVVSYKLKEKSKFKDRPIMLCLVIDKNKVIGAYLDYDGYYPNIAPINFKEYIKQ